MFQKGIYLTRFFFAVIDTASSDFRHSVGICWMMSGLVRRCTANSGTGRITVLEFYGLTEAEAGLGNSGFVLVRSMADHGIADRH